MTATSDQPHVKRGMEMSYEVRMAREIAEIIRDAILAERERCAQIVEGIDKVGRDWAPNSFMAALRRDIAAAIRQDRGE